MPCYRFADFVLSPRRRALTRAGELQPLIPRYFDLLVYLVERRGDAVHRREIYDRLLAAGCRVHAEPAWDAIKIAPDGSKTGYSATYCRDFFGNVFEIMEIHPNDEIKPV